LLQRCRCSGSRPLCWWPAATLTLSTRCPRCCAGPSRSGFGVDAATTGSSSDRWLRSPRSSSPAIGTSIDAYVRGAAASARLAGAGLRRTQTGVVTGYLSWLAVGAVVVAVAGVGLR
jgi:hypothetical protein